MSAPREAVGSDTRASVAPNTRASVAAALAAAFLDGPWSPPHKMAQRGGAAVGVTRGRVLKVAEAVLAAYRDAPRDRPRELARFIGQLPAYEKLWLIGRRPRVVRWSTPGTEMGRTRWPVPPLDDLGALARWADLSVEKLEWFADVRSLERVATGPLRHYDRDWIYNRRGRVRLIERPRPQLKALQRKLLREILDQLPTHEAAHGFVSGRSARTYAAPHAGRDVVLHLDLEAFFATVSAGRVFGVFASLGYPEPVAHTLTGLATTVLPFADRRRAPQALREGDVVSRRRLLERLAHPHLPQGAPSSPALANAIAWRLDLRLAGLAQSFDGRYTRYADDLAFSFDGPDAARRASRLIPIVEGVAAEEGFRINKTKTTLATQSRRQLLCGVVVNDRPAVPRQDRDNLRAILHNCHIHGPQSQNRNAHSDFQAHLLGRISWVAAVNPDHGARLRRQFDLIDWAR